MEFRSIPQTTPTPQRQAPTPSSLPNLSSLDDGAILTGADFKRYAQEAVAQYVTPQVQQTVDMAAATSVNMARTANPDVFSKYGPEIQQELSKVPKNMWTLDNIDYVVNVVKGRHVSELAREEAQRLFSTMEPTIRPMGGGSGPVPTHTVVGNPMEAESVPADWRQRAKQAGITEATIEEFCRSNDMTPPDFWKQFERGSRTPLVAEANIRG